MNNNPTDGLEPDPPLYVTIITVVVFVVVVIAVIVTLWLNRPDPVQITINQPLPTNTPAPTATLGPVTAYVTGAVNSPNQLVTVPYGSRVSDVIAAAGGVTADADLGRVNMAAIVRDGDQIDVPLMGVVQAGLPTANAAPVVYINTATLEELMELPGVGESLAQRIIEYRTANGPFTGLEQLDEVEGIGESLLENLTPLISFAP
jgi:competence protein ComEA